MPKKIFSYSWKIQDEGAKIASPHHEANILKEARKEAKLAAQAKGTGTWWAVYKSFHYDGHSIEFTERIDRGQIVT